MSTAPAAPRLLHLKDGFSNNEFERIALTRFGPLWRLGQAIPPAERFLNKLLVNRAIARVPPRPNPLSMLGDYPSWDSLTDRTYSGRHLPPADAAFQAGLPAEAEVARLFCRPGAPRLSTKSTLLFSNFAQWFTDGFLRTARLPDGQPDPQRNTSNHEIDLSPLYGRTRPVAQALRAHDGTGRLLSQMIPAGQGQVGGEFPPYYFDDDFAQGRSDEPKARGNFRDFDAKQFVTSYERGLLADKFPDGSPKPPEQRRRDLDRMRHHFAMGVERANNQIGYVMLNVIFLREHNRLCKLLKDANPGWDDERLYQTARNTVIVTAMRVVIEEYINHISPFHFKFKVQPRSFDKSPWYRTNWMTAEFNLLYRWHGLVPDHVDLGADRLPLEQTLFNNGLLVRAGVAAAIDSASRQPAGEIGLANTHPYLVREVELPSLRLARAARLRGYNDYREYAGFGRAASFADITADPARQEALERVYGRPDNVEYFVGLFAEDPPANSALPALIGRLVGVDAFSQAFTNPLLAARVFKRDTFAQGWDEFHNTLTLDDVVRRNIPESKTNRAPNRRRGRVDDFPLVTMTQLGWTRS